MPESPADGLDQLVIEILGAVYDNAGVDAFEDAAKRFVMSLCAMLMHESGQQRVRELVEVIAAGLPRNDELVLNWGAVTAAATSARTATRQM
jgi:hypothetical protein